MLSGSCCVWRDVTGGVLRNLTTDILASRTCIASGNLQQVKLKHFVSTRVARDSRAAPPARPRHPRNSNCSNASKSLDKPDSYTGPVHADRIDQSDIQCDKGGAGSDPRRVALWDVPATVTDSLETESTESVDDAKPSSKPNGRFFRNPRVVFRTKRLEQFKTYIFNWGLHRGRPAIKSNPTTVSIPQSYFNAPHRFVRWEGLNEAWEVFWYQNNKLNAKPFPVRLFGLLSSKRRAMDYLENLEKLFGEEAFKRPLRSSSHKNVHYDESLQAWGTTFWRNGKPQSRYFSAGVYGFEAARACASGMGSRLRQQQGRELWIIRRLFKKSQAAGTREMCNSQRWRGFEQRFVRESQ